METKSEDGEAPTSRSLSFYLGAKDARPLPVIPQVAGAPRPRLARDFADVAAGDHPPALAAMLRNRVKRCVRCGKPNGFTLGACNACGASLADVAVTCTHNIFMGFVFGIERGPFPLTISIRHQTEDALFFDDLLALSPLHFNALPTTHWIPDWRHLLRRPAAGLRLVDALHAQCVRIGATQFLSNDAFASALFRTPFSPDDFLAGFNFPPSQYQLHLQFLAPVLLPHQRHLFERGLHFTHGRFFPCAYVRRCLALAAEAPLPAALLADGADVAAIAAHFREGHGYDYDGVHAAFVARADALWHKYARWDAGRFEGAAVLGRGGAGKEEDLVFVPTDASQKQGTDPAEVQRRIDRDRLCLQNYGRPYSADGKPTASYYSFAKGLGDVKSWCD